MNKIKKAECPYCSLVNEIDIEKELARYEMPVYKMLTPEPARKYPKSIKVVCKGCKNPFKIDI